MQQNISASHDTDIYHRSHSSASFPDYAYHIGQQVSKAGGKFRRCLPNTMSYTSPESTSRSRDLSNVSESLYGRQGSSHLGAFPVSLPLDFTPRDLPELQRLHAQMTVDNLRLWECLNIIRCNRRVNGIDVLYDVFSMTDKEFFLNYPGNIVSLSHSLSLIDRHSHTHLLVYRWLCA